MRTGVGADLGGLPLGGRWKAALPPSQGFGTRSGLAGRRCCGAGRSPGTWTAPTPSAACRPACAGSARRCVAVTHRTGELGRNWARGEGRGHGTLTPSELGQRRGVGRWDWAGLDHSGGVRGAVPGGRMGRGPRRQGGSCGSVTPAPRPSRSGPEVRVLLFNSTGDRDPAALLKLLQVRGCPGGGRQAAQPWFWLCGPHLCVHPEPPFPQL